METKNSEIRIQVERNLQTFYLLEHPGYGSDKGLLSTLDGNILEAFKQRQSLRLKTKHSFIESHCEPTANCLLKVTKSNGKITYTITGIVIRTIRFRDLFDFNVQLRTDDPLHRLSSIMKEVDIRGMFNYRYEHSQNNILPPPPSMCRLPFSLDYNLFKENSFLPVGVVNAPDGTSEPNSVTKGKGKNAFNAIFLDGNAVEIPNGPGELPDLDAETNIPTQNRAYKNIKDILNDIAKLFEERPIWTRHALGNKIGQKYGKDNRNLFKALSYIAYMFKNGPWKACWIKFGLDPRLDSKYRSYQSLDLRGINFKQRRIVQSSSKAPISTFKLNQLHQDSKLVASEFETHIIDGIHYTPSRQFQLCDIVDSNYQQLIHSVVYVATEHTAKDGWYIEGHIATIRRRLKQEMKELRSRVFQNSENQESDLDDNDDLEEADKLNMGMMEYMEALGDEDEFDILEDDY